MKPAGLTAALSLSVVCLWAGVGAAAPLKIAASAFPVYDFSRQVSGGRDAVSLIIPPGADSHIFEPSPSDRKKLAEADLFVYISDYMEPWAGRLALRPGVSLQAGKKASCIKVAQHKHHGHGHASGMCDPHIWLDAGNAELMVSAIEVRLAEKDPFNATSYKSNSAAYRKRLQNMDARFKAGLASCRVKTLIHAGHAAFAYLAARYGLSFVSASGVTGDSEPAPSDMMALVREIKRTGAKYIFSEQRVNQRFASALEAETGAQILQLHHIGSVSRQEAASSDYISLMEDNFAALQKGLECRH